MPSNPPRAGGVRPGVLALTGVAVALVLGIALGQWLGAGASAGAAGVDRASDSRALREALAEEREAREELEERLLELELRLAQLEFGGPLLAVPESAAAPDAPAGAEQAAAATPEEPAERPARGQANRSWFDEQKLVASGLDPAEASRLKAAWEEMELGKLYLADRAAREGWGRSFNRRAQQQGLERALRRELGEESWDWILFATGQPNRILVRGVLDSSPAGDAGLQPGDVILSYDGERVFRPGELKRATAEGAPGESIRLELLRDGRTLDLYVPRGPLGAQLRTQRMPPGQG